MKQIVLRVLLATASVACAPLLASAAYAANAANVNIPSQALGPALQDLALQSGVQIIFLSDVVEGRQARPLNGSYTPEAAVAALIEGADLTYYVLNDRTIEVAERTPDAAPAPVSQASADVLDEVEVRARRQRLSSIRAELQRLEEQFYEQYNKFNTAQEYNIVCANDARHGSLVKERTCEPAFARNSSAKSSRASTRCERPGFLAVLMKTPDYQKHMVEVVERHPELLALLKDRYELAQRYQALRNGTAPNEVAGSGAAHRASPRQAPSSGAASPQEPSRHEPSPQAPPREPSASTPSSRSGLAASIATALTGCMSPDLAIEKLPTEEWAVAIGLEPHKDGRKQYFCMPRPEGSTATRSLASCATVGELRRARAATYQPGFFGFAYEVDQWASGQGGFQNMNPLMQP